jgi:hypothetical protein
MVVRRGVRVGTPAKNRPTPGVGGANRTARFAPSLRRAMPRGRIEG